MELAYMSFLNNLRICSLKILRLRNIPVSIEITAGNAFPSFENLLFSGISLAILRKKLGDLFIESNTKYAIVNTSDAVNFNARDVICLKCMAIPRITRLNDIKNNFRNMRRYTMEIFLS